MGFLSGQTNAGRRASLPLSGDLGSSSILYRSLRQRCPPGSAAPLTSSPVIISSTLAGLVQKKTKLWTSPLTRWGIKPQGCRSALRASTASLGQKGLTQRRCLLPRLRSSDVRSGEFAVVQALPQPQFPYHAQAVSAKTTPKGGVRLAPARIASRVCRDNQVRSAVGYPAESVILRVVFHAAASKSLHHF